MIKNFLYLTLFVYFMHYGLVQRASGDPYPVTSKNPYSNAPSLESIPLRPTKSAHTMHNTDIRKKESLPEYIPLRPTKSVPAVPNYLTDGPKIRYFTKSKSQKGIKLVNETLGIGKEQQKVLSKTSFPFDYNLKPSSTITITEQIKPMNNSVIRNTVRSREDYTSIIDENTEYKLEIIDYKDQKTIELNVKDKLQAFRKKFYNTRILSLLDNKKLARTLENLQQQEKEGMESLLEQEAADYLMEKHKIEHARMLEWVDKPARSRKKSVMDNITANQRDNRGRHQALTPVSVTSNQDNLTESNTYSSVISDSAVNAVRRRINIDTGNTTQDTAVPVKVSNNSRQSKVKDLIGMFNSNKKENITNVNNTTDNNRKNKLTKVDTRYSAVNAAGQSANKKASNNLMLIGTNTVKGDDGADHSASRRKILAFQEHSSDDLERNTGQFMESEKKEKENLRTNSSFSFTEEGQKTKMHNPVNITSARLTTGTPSKEKFNKPNLDGPLDTNAANSVKNIVMQIERPKEVIKMDGSNQNIVIKGEGERNTTTGGNANNVKKPKIVQTGEERQVGINNILPDTRVPEIIIMTKPQNTENEKNKLYDNRTGSSKGSAPGGEVSVNQKEELENMLQSHNSSIVGYQNQVSKLMAQKENLIDQIKKCPKDQRDAPMKHLRKLNDDINGQNHKLNALTFVHEIMKQATFISKSPVQSSLIDNTVGIKHQVLSKTNNKNVLDSRLNTINTDTNIGESNTDPKQELGEAIHRFSLKNEHNNRQYQNNNFSLRETTGGPSSDSAQNTVKVGVAQELVDKPNSLSQNRNMVSNNCSNDLVKSQNTEDLGNTTEVSRNRIGYSKDKLTRQINNSRAILEHKLATSVEQKAKSCQETEESVDWDGLSKEISQKLQKKRIPVNLQHKLSNAENEEPDITIKALEQLDSLSTKSSYHSDLDSSYSRTADNKNFSEELLELDTWSAGNYPSLGESLDRKDKNEEDNQGNNKNQRPFNKVRKARSSYHLGKTKSIAKKIQTLQKLNDSGYDSDAHQAAATEYRAVVAVPVVSQGVNLLAETGFNESFGKRFVGKRDDNNNQQQNLVQAQHTNEDLGLTDLFAGDELVVSNTLVPPAYAVDLLQDNQVDNNLPQHTNEDLGLTDLFAGDELVVSNTLVPAAYAVDLLEKVKDKNEVLTEIQKLYKIPYDKKILSTKTKEAIFDYLKETGSTTKELEHTAMLFDVESGSEASKLVLDADNFSNLAQAAEAFRKGIVFSTNAQDIIVHTINQARNILINRIHAIASALTPFVTIGVGSGDEELIDQQKYGVWFTPLYSQGEQKAYKSYLGYKVKSSGGMIGIDTSLGENDNSTIIGAAFAVINRNVKYKTGYQDKTKADSLIFSLYGKQGLTEALFVQGFISYFSTKVRHQEERIFSFNNHIAKGNYTSKSYGGEILLGHDTKLGKKVVFTPFAGISYIKSRDGAYKENGLLFANRNVAANSKDRTDAILGFRLSSSINTNNGMIIPEIHGILFKRINGKTGKIIIKINGMNEQFTDVPKTVNTISTLGFNINTKFGLLEYGAGYDVQLAKKYIEHQGTLKVRVNF